MIQADQPKIFGDNLVVGMSSVEDGNMRFNRGDDEETLDNRNNFFSQVDIELLQATLVQVSYEDNTDFARYHVIEDDRQGEGMAEPVADLHADAIVVTRPGHALFLPLADCIGAVIYDPNAKIMMVSHLGRHSIEIEGAKKSIQYLQQEFGSNPEDLRVWMSPSVGSDSYPLRAFANRSLREVALEQFIEAGVPHQQIESSTVDTAEDENYFSHSQYLSGEQMTDGRFAIVAMMRD